MPSARITAPVYRLIQQQLLRVKESNTFDMIPAELQKWFPAWDSQVAIYLSIPLVSVISEGSDFNAILNSEFALHSPNNRPCR